MQVPEAVQRARVLAGRSRRDVLLVFNREIRPPEPDLIPVRRFPRSIVPTEAFYLYLLKFPVMTTGEPPPR